MIIEQAVTNQLKPDSGQKPTSMNRRTLIGAGLAALLSPSVQVMAQGNHVPNDPFIVLLKGIYQPVPLGQGPDDNLGLSRTVVDLSDGTYSTTQIYPVWTGLPGSQNQDKAIGTFYVSLATFQCAYDLPGGALAMEFTGGSFSLILPDGMGGQFNEGTFPLTILEATGIYSAFAGGHNHMVDRLHQLVAGPVFNNFPLSGYDEFCFCNISTYQFPS